MKLNNWIEIKTLLDISLDIKNSLIYAEDNAFYRLNLNINQVDFVYSLPKYSTPSTDQIDFETNYKPFCNIRLDNYTYAGDRLKVEAAINGTGSENMGSPVLSSKTRVDWSATTINLPALSSPYATIYSYTGSGKLCSFILEFNSDDIFVKLTIDGTEVIFEMDCEELEKLTEGEERLHPFLTWVDDDSKRIIFDPDFPILYNSSVLIEAKCHKESTSKDLKRYIVHLTKET